MKKIIASIILTLISITAIAGNSYCNNRPTGRDVQRCYVNAIEMQHNMIKQYLQKIYASRKLSHEDKLAVSRSMDAWYDEVQQSCRDNACAYDYYVARRNVVIQYYRQNAE